MRSARDANASPRGDRRRFNGAVAGALAAASAGSLAAPFALGAPRTPPSGRKTLRVLLEAAETGFDPAQIADIYSARIAAHIFEALYGYDPLAFPVRLVPLTADGMPEVSDDYRTWTVRLQRGIYFAADPAFNGKRRELVAADYVFSYKRIYDPATKSPVHSTLDESGISGLEALRERALRDKRPFDYETEIEGLRALDRHTIQFRLDAPRPRFATTLADSSNYGAVARELVAAYGADLAAHPVGTGPYRLKSWRRSSRIVLEKSPDYRDVRYASEPAEGDAQAQAWAARFRGRRLPLNDEVEISVIEEGQPRYLSFLNGESDIVRVPPEFAPMAAPNGRLAPNLARRGIALRRFVNPDFTTSYFNMDDPVVGGYSAEKVALRRALNLAYDIDYEVGIVRRGQAIPAQAPMPPGTYGYDAAYRSVNAVHDVARAKALLDLYGYVDRNGDGWRERPDGSPLELRMATQQSQIERQLDETWQKSLAAVGIRIRFETSQWPENFKAARAGKLQMWSLGSTSAEPDAQGALEPMYGPAIGQGNYARFKLPAFDAIYRRMLDLPDSPERAELFKRASELIAAYMPYRIHVHRIYNDLTQPWIAGFRQPLFRPQVWQYVDVDDGMRARMEA